MGYMKLVGLIWYGQFCVVNRDSAQNIHSSQGTWDAIDGMRVLPYIYQSPPDPPRVFAYSEYEIPSHSVPPHCAADSGLWRNICAILA